MMETPERFIAVDWSGDASASGQKRKIWIADWNEVRVTLKSGIDRRRTVESLANARRETPALVVGLDFAFSYPKWFIEKQDCATARSFWKLIADGKGQEWLTRRNDFFWGREGVKRPQDHRQPEWRGHRQTERHLVENGDGNGNKLSPKSPFQIGGAGAVGTGSLRGIQHLIDLKNVGFSIWPFDEPTLPVAIEIYPRIFTGKVKTSSCRARSIYLRRPPYDTLSEEVRNEALDSEDAFDALCSVIGMKNHAQDFTSLQQATDPVELLEGQIWRPLPSPESGQKK